MPTRRTALCQVLGATAAAAGPHPARALAPVFPTRDVRIVVPFGPGGAADTLPRCIGERLADRWGHRVLVENRPGASGLLGMTHGLRAQPDGHTLICAPVGTLAIRPHLTADPAYDVQRDLTPITMLGQVELVLATRPDQGLDSLAAVIARARAEPGGLSYAAAGAGSQAQLAVEMLAAALGLQLLHLPYKGLHEALRDVLGGVVDLIVAQLPALQPLLRSGELRPLGVASREPSRQLPAVPTLASAAGLPGFEAMSWHALVGPAGMPSQIVDRIQRDVALAVRSPGLRERLDALGIEPLGSTPQVLARLMASDLERYGAIVRRLGLPTR